MNQINTYILNFKIVFFKIAFLFNLRNFLKLFNTYNNFNRFYNRFQNLIWIFRCRELFFYFTIVLSFHLIINFFRIFLSNFFDVVINLKICLNMNNDILFSWFFYTRFEWKYRNINKLYLNVKINIDRYSKLILTRDFEFFVYT